MLFRSDQVCVFRLQHPESVRFNQVVVFGRRKKAHLRGEPKGADELLRIAYKPHLLPVLNQELGERYAIPPSSPVTITYTGLPLDEIEDALGRSVAMQNVRGILVRKQQKMTGRPVTPLHKGHVGLLGLQWHVERLLWGRRYAAHCPLAISEACS